MDNIQRAKGFADIIRNLFEQDTSTQNETQTITNNYSDTPEKANQPVSQKQENTAVNLGPELTQNTTTTNTNLSPVNWDFIGQLEGQGVNRGYVPTNNKGKVFGVSGVTVGTGFDLGQHSEADLKRMGISESLSQKLKPYLRKKKGDAVNYLKRNPLELSDTEVAEIDSKVKEAKLQDLIRKYNSSNPSKEFESLSPEQKTVLASLSFQYGDLRSRTPRTWKRALNNNWDGVLAELRNFGDNYDTRRNKEADLLASSMNV